MPRDAKKLTKADLDSLKKWAKDNRSATRTLADAGQPGLYVQARSGRVVFLFRYRPPDGGNRRTMRIDDYPAITLDQARDIALTKRGEVASEVDPLDKREERRRQGKTVEDAADAYLGKFQERVAKGQRKPSSLDSARRRLEKNVLPNIGSKLLQKLTRKDVKSLHSDLPDHEYNRTVTTLSAAYTYATEDLEWIGPDKNPCHRAKDEDAVEADREPLTEEDLRALGAALMEARETGGVRVPVGDGETAFRTVNPSAVLAMYLFALTGFRRAELLGHSAKVRRGPRPGLRWEDVKFESGEITLINTKSGVDQVRAVGDVVIDLLRDAKPADAEPHHCVIPGTTRSQPFVGIDKPRRALYSAAGIKGKDLQCLRHTFGTIGASLDHGKYVAHLSALLGHTLPTKSRITQKYARPTAQAYKPTADAISSEIAIIMGI